MKTYFSAWRKKQKKNIVVANFKWDETNENQFIYELEASGDLNNLFG